MDLRAWVISGCWPVMARRSATAPSMALESVAASPTPMFTTIFSILGICMTFLYSNFFCSSSRTTSTYCFLRRGVSGALAWATTASFFAISCSFFRTWRVLCAGSASRLQGLAAREHFVRAWSRCCLAAGRLVAALRCRDTIHPWHSHANSKNTSFAVKIPVSAGTFRSPTQSGHTGLCSSTLDLFTDRRPSISNSQTERP